MPSSMHPRSVTRGLIPLLAVFVLSSAFAAFAQISDDDRSCINDVNKAAMNVAKAQGKENATCVRNAVKGKEPDPEYCIVADGREKVIKKEQKTLAAALKSCVVTPPFGYTGPVIANNAAKNQEAALVDDVYGVDVHGALLNSVGGSQDASCQAGVTKNLEKVFKTALKSFRICKKKGLKTGAIVDAAGLEGCFDDVAADPNVTKAIGKMSDKFAEQCGGLNLPLLFPGYCFGAPNQPACFGSLVRCRVCRMVNAMDATAADCDQFDDSLPNLSCVFTPTTTTTTTLPDGG